MNQLPNDVNQGFHNGLFQNYEKGTSIQYGLTMSLKRQKIRHLREQVE